MLCVTSLHHLNSYKTLPIFIDHKTSAGDPCKFVTGKVNRARHPSCTRILALGVGASSLPGHTKGYTEDDERKDYTL